MVARVRFTILVAVWMASVVAALADDATPAIPTFVEETASAGIESVYAGDWEYMVGGGAAAFDCNGDAYPDLLLAGGAEPAKFHRNVSTRGGPMKFEQQKSGLELDAVTGAYPLDVDGDGIMDIVLLRVGENVVMRGLGECRFERANEAWGFDGGDAWSIAFAATWESGADWPTLAVGNYIDRTQDIRTSCLGAPAPTIGCTGPWRGRAASGRHSR
jgi:hypothetical protein